MECIQLFRRIRINWKFYWCENMGRRHKPHDDIDIITRNEYVYYKNIDTALHAVFNVLSVQLKDQYIANI
jgi:hypothetical protein